MSESVTIGDQAFIKDPNKGWIDKKTKQPADKGLLRLLDSLDIQPVKARLKVDIDNSIEPITLGPNEKYVFDKNSGWIDSKTKQPAKPDMLKLLDSLKSKVNGAQDTSKPAKPKATPKAKPKPKKPKAAPKAETPEPEPVAQPESKLKSFAKGTGKVLASAGAGMFGINLQETLADERDKKEESKARYQELVDTYYTIEVSKEGVKKYRDTRTGKFISPIKAAEYDLAATKEFKIAERKRLVKNVGKGFASGVLGAYGFDLQQILDEEKQKKEKVAEEKTAEKETESAKTKKEPKGSKALDKPSISVLSNSFTNLITSFNGMDVYSKNINAIHKAQADAAADISKESTLEANIPPAQISSGGSDNVGDYLASTLPDITKQLDTLTELIDSGALQGAGSSIGGNIGQGGGLKRIGKGLKFAKGAAAVAVALEAVDYATGEKKLTARNLTGSAGGLAGAAAGAEGGALAGAAIGSVVPVVGTAIGGVVGGLAGGALGYYAGSKVGTAGYDAVAKPKPTGESAAAKQQEIKATTQAAAVKAKEQKAEQDRQGMFSGSFGMQGLGSKLASWLGGTFQNVSTYVSHIPDKVAELARQYSESAASALGVGTGSYAEANLTGVKGDWVKDAPFITEVNRVSQKFNIDAGDLLGMMQSESGINPAALNSSGGASGLIQFMPATAKNLGTTTQAIRGMSRAQQMPLVEKYFDMVGLPRGASAGQLYTSVFLPAFVKKPSNYVIAAPGGTEKNPSGSWYKQNKGLDVNNDGQITISDLTDRVSKMRQQIGLGPSKVVSGFSAFTGAAGNAVTGAVGSVMGAAGQVVGAVTDAAKYVAGGLTQTASKFIGMTEGRGADQLNAFIGRFFPQFLKGNPRGVGGQAWCAAFTNAVLGSQGLPGTGNTLASSFLNYGSIVYDRPTNQGNMGNAQPGDIVVVNWDNPGVGLPGRPGNHVGFIATPPANGRFRMIGGNQSDKSKQSGGAVTNVGGGSNAIVSIRRPGGKAAKPGQPAKPVSPKAAPVVRAAADAAIDTAAKTAHRAVEIASNAVDSAKSGLNYLFGAPAPPKKPAKPRTKEYQRHLVHAKG
jgi:hypothetical protein